MEYVGVRLLLFSAGILPLKALHIISSILGDLLYKFSSKRRDIALTNLREAFKDSRSEDEIRSIASQSCRSLFLTFLEIIKSRSVLSRDNAVTIIRQVTEGLDELFLKAKRAHDESGGCIFVTPHIGNWEVLPHISAIAGIPIAIVVRPLDNKYLEKLIYAQRAGSGQIIIPKSNAMFQLQRTLMQGSSIGLLPDQSTMKGIEVDFFGRKAATTPVPAILAINYNRPVVVVACCRKPDGHYEGFVSNPIYPQRDKSEKAEIFRITEEMNREMEAIIRKYPEQYLWMHNRWKKYKNKKELMAKY